MELRPCSGLRLFEVQKRAICGNEAAGGITRLVDMGIEPFLVASSLVGLLAQRLVRRPCKECARPVKPSDEVLRELGLDVQTFRAGGYHFPNVKGMRPPPPRMQPATRADGRFYEAEPKLSLTSSLDILKTWVAISKQNMKSPSFRRLTSYLRI